MKFRDQYMFLSNFAPCEIEYEGIAYSTSEHAYQAAKTLDVGQKVAISILDTPGKAKRAGKLVSIRPDWNSIKLQVMLDILRIKFSNPNMKKLLLDTGNTELVEDNMWGDTFWGRCNGVGRNHLGKLLMQVRDEIR
jgi:N-glycosidase YbiA